MGKTSIAFLDLTQMSILSKIGTFIACIVIFFLIGWYFYKNLFVKEASPFEKKREKLRAKREG